LKGNFFATAWNNGRHHKSGSGYGLKINISDALAHFKKVHKSIHLKLDGQEGEITVNIDKPSFWSKDCCELINKEIGLWLIKNNKAPWKFSEPPTLQISHISDNKYSVKFSN